MSLTRREELQKLSIKNGLRPIAKNLGIKSVSNMNKNFLIDSILNFERTPTQSPYSTPRREELQKLSIKNGLRPIAKSLGIKNISKMNKNFLIDSILDFERTPTQIPYPAPRSIFSSQRKIFPTITQIFPNSKNNN